MLEDHVEKSHQEGEKHDQTVARLASSALRTASFCHREKTANDPKVPAAKNDTLERTSRKRKGPGLVAERSSAKKQARDTQRSVNLATK